MTKTEAKRTMREFLTKHAGTTVFFMKLTPAEKHAYVLVDSFNYFRFLPAKERLERAIKNAQGHKDSGYKFFENVYERMSISEK